LTHTAKEVGIDMFCNYDDNPMEIEYIDVTHKYDGKEKRYYQIPRYKCRCGYARVPYPVYDFMNENMDNDRQYLDKN
jgi:hypothetical protein